MDDGLGYVAWVRQAAGPERGSISGAVEPYTLPCWYLSSRMYQDSTPLNFLCRYAPGEGDC